MTEIFSALSKPQVGYAEVTRTLLETFVVQGVVAGIAESQQFLCHAMHSVVADRTIVVGTGDTILASRSAFSFGGGGFTCSTSVCFSDPLRGNGVGSDRGFGEDGGEFACEKGSERVLLVDTSEKDDNITVLLIPETGLLGNLEN